MTQHIKDTAPITAVLSPAWDAMTREEQVDVIKQVFAPSRMADINRLMAR